MAPKARGLKKQCEMKRGSESRRNANAKWRGEAGRCQHRDIDSKRAAAYGSS